MSGCRGWSRRARATVGAWVSRLGLGPRRRRRDEMRTRDGPRKGPCRLFPSLPRSLATFPHTSGALEGEKTVEKSEFENKQGGGAGQTQTNVVEFS